MKQLSRMEYDQMMTELLALYGQFDEAINQLKQMGREFGPGSDERFDDQVDHIQELRRRLVEAENFDPAVLPDREE